MIDTLTIHIIYIQHIKLTYIDFVNVYVLVHVCVCGVCIRVHVYVYECVLMTCGMVCGCE